MEELFGRHRALDIRSYLAAYLGCSYSEASRTKIPEEWTEGLKITHNALDDARQQGRVLVNMMKANGKRFVDLTQSGSMVI